MDIGPVAVQTTLEQIDIVYRMVDMYSDVFEIAYNAEDVRRIFASGKIASMMGMEGGHQINCSMASLRMFYRLGVRYMTLTHNGGPTWADSAVSITGEFIHDAPNNGLSPFGKEVVLEMNRIGMLVDLSHVHHVTMRVALEVSRAPVIFSHSSTRALCNHPRDVPDDILRMLPTNGGVVMITFVSKFVAGPFWVRGGKVGATVIEVADHIDHVKEVAGIDHIGTNLKLSLSYFPHIYLYPICRYVWCRNWRGLRWMHFIGTRTGGRELLPQSHCRAHLQRLHR